jgi:hypothetical protein
MNVLELGYQIWSGFIRLRIVVVVGYYEFLGFVMKTNSMTDRATVGFSTCCLRHGFNLDVIFPKILS